jgi:hypothetical protein
MADVRWIKSAAEYPDVHELTGAGCSSRFASELLG